MDRPSLERLLSEGLSLAEIGRRVGLHEATIGYWVKKHGLEAVNRERHAARGGMTREELQPMVDAGMSIAEIAASSERSKATVRHWLREYGLKTRRAEQRRASIEQGKRLGDIVVCECAHHGLTEFKRRSAGGLRCLRCRSEAVTRRRRKVKRILVEEAGGACMVCGYDSCIAALEFHHLEPGDKQFALSHRSARSMASSRAEAKKCVLLCANCHSEVEAGMLALEIPSAAARVESRASSEFVPG
jgi:transposase